MHTDQFLVLHMTANSEQSASYEYTEHLQIQSASNQMWIHTMG